MPELNLYVWYHAEPELEPELRNWLKLVFDQLGYAGSLLRRDSDLKYTFMEVYEDVDILAAERIESLATKQGWMSRLQGPRRCESFKVIIQTGAG